MGANPGSRASTEPVSRLGPSGFDPERLLADICSDRVLLACDNAKAVPGDVWGKGAEGHYAFLCGLAALLNIESEMLEDMIEHSKGRAKWFNDRHPEAKVTMRVPARILHDLGFTAIATEAGTAETHSGSVHEGAGREASPNSSSAQGDR